MVLGITALLFVGYQYMNRSSENDSDLLTRTRTDTASEVGAQVLSALNQLRSLRLDESVFTDPTFQSLRDFSRPIQNSLSADKILLLQ